MKKNDYFIDVSSYQSADLTAICQAAGTNKTIIKVSEGTSYLSPNRFTQASTSEPIGYYHFARFGGNVSQAVAEANYLLANLPTEVPYLVCDYEDDASSSKQANTDAILAFMDRCASTGYKPIYYSYKPYTLANVDYHQILAKYPDSLWIAAYPNYNVTPYPVWSVFPSMDGIRWWQFTSTAIPEGLDKNIVLLDDDTTTQTIIQHSGGQDTMDFLFHITGDPSWNEGTVYFYNGNTNQIRALADPDEIVILRQVFKDNNGRDLPSYEWNNKAPWYARFFRAMNPDSTSSEIKEAIKIAKEQSKATIEAITEEIKKSKDIPQKVEVTIKEK